MTIVRHGYATHKRNGSTRAYRKQRQAVLASATHCALCGAAFKPGEPIDTDHIHAYADHGHGPLQATHPHCNRSKGRA